MDTTQLVRQHFLPEYPPLSRGHISGVVELVAGKPKQKAAVTAFTDLLMVILPGASSEALYGPCKWPAIHGSTFPAVGAEVQVGVDETNHPVVLWWDGSFVAAAAESITKAMLTKGTVESFLQLLTVANRKVAFGNNEVEWPGKAFESAVLTISTGLTTANFFLAFPFPGNALVYVSGVTVKAGGKVEVQGRGAVEIAAGTKVQTHWIAIE